MAALNFPNSPSLNDTHTENGVTFKWNGAAWDRLGDIGAQGSAGAAGAQGAAGAAGAQGSAGAAGAQGAIGPVAGSSSQVVYKDGSNNPTGSSSFTFDGTNLTVGGNVSIGGTLTYEDVTNIDSVGIITARDKIKLTSADGQIEATGATGLSINASGASAFARFYTANTERLRINANGIFDFKDNSFTNVGSIALDFIKGDADDDTNITFAGGDTITFKAGSTSPALTINTTQVKVEDNQKFVAGTGNDLQIYHSSGDAYITNSDGNLNIVNSIDGWIRLQPKSGEEGVIVKYDGAVELYHDNSKKFETTSGGVEVSSGNLTMQSNGRIFVGNGGNATNPMFANVSDTNTGIAFPAADTMIFTTGGSERLRIDADGTILTNAATIDNTSSHGVIVAHAPASNADTGYKSIEIGNSNGSGSNRGSTICGQPKSNSHPPYTLIGCWDTGSSTDVYYGGGWGSNMRPAMQHRFYTNSSYPTANGSGTERIRIAPGGWLNIGGNFEQSSYTAQVTRIGGNTDVVQIKGNVGNSFMRFTDNDASSDYTLGSDDGSGAGAGTFVLYDRNNSVYRVVVNSSGNIGVRNTNPSSKVHIGDLVSSVSSDINTTHTSLIIKQTNNDNKSGFYIERSGERKGYYMWMNPGGGSGDGLTFTRNNNGTKSDAFILDRDANLWGGGTFYPLSDNAYDLGSASNRWRNVYTTDLQLSNEGSQNDVDGTWGSYTIQEGEDELFLINRRNGKKYKFNLTEVN